MKPETYLIIAPCCCDCSMELRTAYWSGSTYYGFQCPLCGKVVEMRITGDCYSELKLEEKEP